MRLSVIVVECGIYNDITFDAQGKQSHESRRSTLQGFPFGFFFRYDIVGGLLFCLSVRPSTPGLYICLGSPDGSNQTLTNPLEV